MSFLKKKNREKGFTAPELLIAVMILVIAVAVATPFFLGTVQSYRLRATAWRVGGDLRLARQKSVSWGKSYRIHFHDEDYGSNPNSYTIERNEGGGTWTQDPNNRIYLQEPGSATQVRIDRTSTPSGGYIYFSANGTVSTAGTMRLVDRRGKRYDVAINSVGRVNVTKL